MVSEPFSKALPLKIIHRDIIQRTRTHWEPHK